jgi:hypothetical protein
MQLLLLINDNYDKYTEKHKKNLSLPIWIKSVFMELVMHRMVLYSHSERVMSCYYT